VTSRRLPSIAFAALLACWLPAISLSGQQQSPARGFNVLLVTLDTVRADRLGPWGYEPARTPTLDALAASGIVWLDAVAPTPITLPSHASLMTGLAPPKHGVRDNGSFRLAEEKRTLAETLAGAGYETGSFVGSFVLDRRFGLGQGFATYDDDLGGGVAASGAFAERSAEAVTEGALEWLAGREGADAPFFLWVHYFDAHSPYGPPAAFRTGDPYDGEIAYVDAQLARLVSHLEASGQRDRTLIVVTADHGESLGEHGEPSHSIFIYESTLHIPLILSSPGLYSEPRVVEDRVAGLVDVAPTLLSLLGVDGLPDADGVDLLAAPADPDRAVYIESLAPQFGHGWAPLTGLRRHRDKFIQAPEPEYYDLGERPLEMRNRADEAEAARDLSARLATLTAGDLVAARREVSAEERAKLESLGYVVGASISVPSGADPKERMPYYNQFFEAFALAEEGRLSEAAEILEASLRHERGSAKAWELAATIFVRLSRFEDAAAAIVKAVDLSPNADRLVKLAQMRAMQGDLPEAQRLLDAAEALDPEDGSVWMIRGNLAAAGGDFARAIECFEAAARVDPSRVGEMARSRIEIARSRLQR